MRSIIQEASSVTKAIELGWVKAGKPREFNIRVYEEAEKNFFGFTTKQAKIAIFFGDRHGGPARYRRHGQQRRRPHHRSDWRRQDTRPADGGERRQVESQQEYHPQEPQDKREE